MFVFQLYEEIHTSNGKYVVYVYCFKFVSGVFLYVSYNTICEGTSRNCIEKIIDKKSFREKFSLANTQIKMFVSFGSTFSNIQRIRKSTI